MSSKLNRNPIPDTRRKLVIVGDGGCGKTCLLTVFTENIFPERYIPTVFENRIVNVVVDGKKVQLALWDTAGQEDYDRLRPLSYPDTDVLLVTFSLVSPLSYENVINKWYPEVQHFCEGVPTILVGLKSDLKTDPTTLQQLTESNQKPITFEQGVELRNHIRSIKYLECSSRTGEGVTEIFQAATKACLKQPKLKAKFGSCMLL